MTFSLVARCARTREFGAVISTSNAAVGSRCCFLEAGVGGFLTQHRTDPRLGPRGLDLLRQDVSAVHAMAAVVASSPGIGWRQLACVDRHGGTAYFHGDRIYSVREAAEAPGVVAIGNIIDNPSVPGAMVEAFTADPSLTMGERLLRAIEAGEAAGGETGVVHSAQMICVGAHSFPLYDLRIDWSETPIPDLRRLWERYETVADGFPVRVLDPDTVPPETDLYEAARRRKQELGITY